MAFKRSKFVPINTTSNHIVGLGCTNMFKMQFGWGRRAGHWRFGLLRV